MYIANNYNPNLHSNPNQVLVTELNKKWLRAKSARQDWENRGIAYESLVNNNVEGTQTQNTAAQLKELEKKYSIPLSANVIYAVKQQIQAYLTSTNPSINVVPVGASSKEFAYAWRELVIGTLRINRFSKHLRRAIGDAVTVGHGVIVVEPSNYFNMNEFNVVTRRVRWSYVYVDNFSESDDNYRDAEFIVISKPLPKSKAMKEYDLTETEATIACTQLQQDSFNPFQTTLTSGYPQTELLWVQEWYMKEPATCYIMKDGTRTCDSKFAEVSVFNFKGKFIKKICKVGNFIKYQEMMPIEDYPFMFFVFDHCDNPFPNGIIHYIAPIQKAINRAIGLTLEHAQKASNWGIIAAKGAISDMDEFSTQMSVPGGVAEYEFDPSMPNGGQPIQKQPAPLNQAWFTLFKELISLIEYISGMNDILRGSSENVAPTATQQNQLASFGTARVKMIAKGIDDTLDGGLNVMIQFIQAYSPQSNILRYLNDTDAMISIRTDVEGAVRQSVNEQGQLQEQFHEQAGGQQLATVIQNETTGKVVSIVGALKLGQYKVAYSSSNGLPTARLMAQQVLTTVMSRMGNDATAIAIMKAALKLMDIPDIDIALKEADLTVQQAQQLQQLQKELQQTVIENQSLKDDLIVEKENVVLAELKAKVNTMEGKFNVELSKLKEGVKDRNAQLKKEQNEVANA